MLTQFIAKAGHQVTPSAFRGRPMTYFTAQARHCHCSSFICLFGFTVYRAFSTALGSKSKITYETTMSNQKSEKDICGKQEVHSMTSGVPELRASASSFATSYSPESLVDADSDDQLVLDNDSAIWMEGSYEEENDFDPCGDNRKESTLPRTSETLPELKPKISHFWRRRIVELFVIQLALLASIQYFSQINNRLSMTTSTIVSGSEARAVSPSRNNTSALMNGEVMVRDYESGAEDCIYVPGGGFSGFWFSLGRLQSIQNPHNETFVCYSAGCLGVVATLLHQQELLKNGGIIDGTNNDHYHNVYDMARSIQIEWETGKRHRYRVVESFIDGLFEKIVNGPDDEWKTLFLDTIQKNLNIVTTTYEDDDFPSQQQLLPQSILPRAVVRRPSDLASLKRLLMQSSWIPIATGSSWTHKGHLDGGLSAPQHPKCSRTVGLEVSAPAMKTESADKETSSWLRNQILLLGNTLNVNLGREQVGTLWKIGMERGV